MLMMGTWLLVLCGFESGWRNGRLSVYLQKSGEWCECSSKDRCRGLALMGVRKVEVDKDC